MKNGRASPALRLEAWKIPIAFGLDCCCLRSRLASVSRVVCGASVIARLEAVLGNPSPTLTEPLPPAATINAQDAMDGKGA